MNRKRIINIQKSIDEKLIISSIHTAVKIEQLYIDIIVSIGKENGRLRVTIKFAL